MPDFTTPIFALVEPTVGADNGTWGGVLNGDIGNLDTYLGVLRQAAKVLTIGATTTLDFNAPASVFKLTVTQATTIAIANTPANITAQQLSTQFTLILVNGGAFAVTWPASFVWSGGSPPTLQAAGTDVIVGWSPDNGTTWYTAALMTPSTGQKPVLVLTPTAGGNTNQNTEVSLGTVVIPAGKLAVVGDSVRITAIFDATNGPNLLFVTFGPTSYVLPAYNTGSGASRRRVVIEVVRTGATSQLACALVDGAAAATYTVPAETLANTVTVDFRGNAQFNGTLTLRLGRVEVLTA